MSKKRRQTPDEFLRSIIERAMRHYNRDALHKRMHKHMRDPFTGKDLL